jgi:hypothetical protein
VIPLFCLLSFWLVTSYGFLFSIERGNFDIYTGLAAITGLWMMVRRPSSVWLQVLCFSIAAHLKVYPAILFVLVVWKHGWKSLLPLGVVNLVLLLSLGPANVVNFVRSVTGAVEAPYIWVGNHSAAAFGALVNNYLGERGLGWVPPWLFYLLPIGLWIFGCLLLVRRGYSNAGAIWLYALSVPMMNLMPATSHDYKLVLLAAPLALSLLFVTWEFAASGRLVRLLQIVAVGALAAMLALAYTRLPTVLEDKYPFILALQAVIVWIFVTRPARSVLEPGLVEAPAPA